MPSQGKCASTTSSPKLFSVLGLITRFRWHAISILIHHANGAAELRATQLPVKDQSDRITYDISHLCHNQGCSNPDHILVEDSKDNYERNSCHTKFRYEVQGLGGLIAINPCVHRALLKSHKECILPLMQIENPGYYEGDLGLQACHELKSRT